MQPNKLPQTLAEQVSGEYTGGLQMFGLFAFLRQNVSNHMIRCLLLLCLMGTLPVTAQKYDLFEMENEELFWRCTYTYTGGQDSIRRAVVSMLKSKVFTQNVIRNELGYNGEVRHYLVNCRKYGRTYTNTPRIYWDGEWSGKFMVEVEENRYRVSIYGLYFENTNQPSSYYRNQNARKGFYVKEVLKKSKAEFKKGVRADMALLSLSLKDAFDIRNVKERNPDW